MAMTRGQNLIGKVMGSCVLECVLGYGGSSAVYLAQDQQTEHKVAVKVFLTHSIPGGQMPKDFYRRFLREAKAASKLDHPNILPIYSYGEQDGLPYIVMPYMPGGTLADYLKKHGAISLQEAAWYIEQIAAALDYAHEHGCIHCDVKPANILLDNDGQIQLSDFGIARSHGENEGERSFARNPEALTGTPDYISPEQAMGREVDGRSDIYSLGITLFSMLANRLPFHADTTIALALLHVHKPPPSLARIRSDVTDGIDQVLFKALAKKPEDRYQSVQEFSLAFAQAVEEAERTETASGKRATVVVRNTGQLSGPLSWEVSPDPALPTRSLIQRFGLVRIISVAFLLLSFLLSGSFLTILALSHANRPSVANINSTSLGTSPGQNTSSDLLADHNSWLVNSTFFYKDGGYHIHNTSSLNISLVMYQSEDFSDFDLLVTMAQMKRPEDQYAGDYYGVVFRVSSNQEHYYLFEIDPANGNQYIFSRYDAGTKWRSIATGTVPSFDDTPGHDNTLSVRARGNSFLFTVDDKPVGTVASDTYKPPLSNGYVGLYVENKGCEVAFSRLYVNKSR